jgi:hypothetical protein
MFTNISRHGWFQSRNLNLFTNNLHFSCITSLQPFYFLPLSVIVRFITKFHFSFLYSTVLQTVGGSVGMGLNHRVHRVATAAFWRTFSHEGKIGPGWWGWGVHAHPLLLHLPSSVKLQCTLQLSGQIHWPCFNSTNICTLWSKPQRPQARRPALIAVLLSLAGGEGPGPRERGVMVCTVIEATLGNRATAITQITKFSKGHTQVYI